MAGLGVLEALGQGEAVRNRLLGILDEGNEDDVHFRITSPYVIAVSRPITD